MEIEKFFVGTRLFPSPVLVTKFGLSASSGWSPGLMQNLTIWPSDFQNSTQYLISYHILVLEFSFAEKSEKLKQKEN